MDQTLIKPASFFSKFLDFSTDWSISNNVIEKGQKKKSHLKVCINSLKSLYKHITVKKSMSYRKIGRV